MLIKVRSYELYKKHDLPLHFREGLFCALAVPFHLAMRHVRLLTFLFSLPLQGKWEVPVPKVRAQGETEVLKVIRTGKRKRKAWKRMVTKVCFVGDGFTRKPPKYERFIRPMVMFLSLKECLSNNSFDLLL